MTEVRVLAAARRELSRSFDYFEGASLGLGGDLTAEVDAAFRRILIFPEHGSPYLAGTRRVLLLRFHISVVYVLKAEGPLVVAFAPDRMRPGYWIGRVPHRRRSS